MNKIRVIDLLNKIANGEEVPKKVKYKTHYWEYKEEAKDYKDNEDDWVFSCSNYDIPEMLNVEVEIIEEDKKIKRILTYTTPDDEDFAYEDGDKPHNVCVHFPIEKLFIKKINELSDEINNLKEGE